MAQGLAPGRRDGRHRDRGVGLRGEQRVGGRPRPGLALQAPGRAAEPTGYRGRRHRPRIVAGLRRAESPGQVASAAARPPGGSAGGGRCAGDRLRCPVPGQTRPGARQGPRRVRAQGRQCPAHRRPGQRARDQSGGRAGGHRAPAPEGDAPVPGASRRGLRHRPVSPALGAGQAEPVLAVLARRRRAVGRQGLPADARAPRLCHALLR